MLVVYKAAAVQHWTTNMAATNGHSLIIAGNVYFCDFRKRVARKPRPSPRAANDPRTVRLTAETVQQGCRDLMGAASMLVRQAELNAADLISVTSMIDELAFHAQVMAGEHGDADPQADSRGIGADDLQQLLLEGAAVMADVQSCLSEAHGAAEQMTRRLRAQAERALRLGWGVAQMLETIAHDDNPASS